MAGQAHRDAFEVQLCSSETYPSSIPALGELLRCCVEGGASINFVLPFSQTDAENFWQDQAGDVSSGQQLIFVARSRTVDGRSEDGGDGGSAEDATEMDASPAIAGCVILKCAWQPNGQHRGEVAKMLVHPSYRQRGLGSLLLRALEKEAVRRGRWLLTLDTEVDSPAERLYRKEGYQELGVIPSFASSNSGKIFLDTRFYYKLLARP